MYVVDGAEATLVTCHTQARDGRDFVRGALDAATRCGASSLQLTIGPDYPGTEAMIGELVERGAQVVATDDILAAEPPSTASRIAPSPDVDVVQVCTFPDVVDFERISARGWGYPEPTTEQHEDAYARLTPGWFLARCDEQRAGTAGFALVGEVARLWGGGSRSSAARPRGVSHFGASPSRRRTHAGCHPCARARSTHILTHSAATGLRQVRRTTYLPGNALTPDMAHI